MNRKSKVRWPDEKKRAGSDKIYFIQESSKKEQIENLYFFGTSEGCEW
jgi:hypothetical protein